MDFSLIIPAYNEADNLPTFLSTASSCFDGQGLDYELLFIDDGSSDDTERVLREAIDLYRQNKSGKAHIRVVELSRNFGKEAALYAGLERAQGDVVGFIDADMQQDPKVALQMFLFLKENPEYDCVAAVQDSRLESWPLKTFKRLFYKSFNKISDTHVIADVSDFRVFTRQVARALLSLKESFRFSKGLFSWIGFKTHVITYEVHERHAGKSKWKLRQLISYAWNGVLAFSTWPLRVVMYAGIILALISLLFIGIDLVGKLAFNNNTPADMTILYVTLLLGGIQMFVLGLLGEYMARTYLETKKRPLYVERSSFSSNPFSDAIEKDMASEEDAERS